MVTAMSVAARQLPMYDQALEALQATHEQLSSYGVIQTFVSCFDKTDEYLMCALLCARQS